MIRLTKTACVAWRKKSDYPNAETHRGKPTTPKSAQAWVDKLNKEYPNLHHWVESIIDRTEAIAVLNQIGYELNEFSTDQEVEDALAIANLTGEVA